MANQEKGFPGALNPCWSTLKFYCKGKPGYAMLGSIEEENCCLARLRYGKANILAYYLYDDKYAITDVVFDLTKVYKKYGKKFGSYQNFLGRVLNSVDLPFFYLQEWKDFYSEKNIEVIGCPIAGMSSRPFHKYCVWTPSLKALFTALDRVLGNSFCDMDKENVENLITKSGGNSILPFVILWGLGVLGGLILVILAIAGTINKVVGWLFGIILILGCGLGLAIFIYAYILMIKTLVDNNDDDKFIVADYSQFTRM